MSRREPVMHGDGRSPLRYPPRLSRLLRLTEWLGARGPSDMPPIYLSAAEQADWCHSYATADEQDALREAFAARECGALRGDLLAAVIRDAALQRGRQIAEAYSARFPSRPAATRRGAPGNPPLTQDLIFALVAIACESRARFGAQPTLNRAFDDVAMYLGPGVKPCVVRRAYKAAAHRMSGWLAGAKEEPPSGDEIAPERHYRRAAFGFSFQRVFELAFAFLESDDRRAKVGPFAAFVADIHGRRCASQSAAEASR